MGKAVFHAGQRDRSRPLGMQLARRALWVALLLPTLALAAIDAQDDSFVGSEDTPLTRNVFGNDSQSPGTFNIDSFTQPTHGSVTFDLGGNFTFTPDGDYAGPDSFEYTIRPTDADCLTPLPPTPGHCADRATATVTLDVLAVADNPSVSASNVAGDEDTSIALTLAAAAIDVDGSETIEARLRNVPSGSVVTGGTDEGGGVWLLAAGSLGSVAVTPPPNANGTGTLTFEATAIDTASNTDSQGNSIVFQVNVAPVNDPPTVVAPPAPSTVNEDSDIRVSLAGVFQDIDSALALSIASIGGDPVTVTGSETIVGLELRANLEPEANGTVSFVVEADDGQAPPVSVTVVVNVTAINDTPVLVSSLPDLVFDEDGGSVAADLTGAFDDADIATNGDSLTYTFTTSDPSLFDSASVVAGSQINFTLAENANGAANVVVTATDEAGATAQDSFSLTVNPVNDPPTVENAIGTLNLPEDAPAQFRDLTKVFGDVDILTNGDLLAYSIVSNSNPALFGDLSISGDSLKIEVAPDTNGTATVVVQADDGDATVTDTFTVIVAFVNDIPIPADDAVTMVEDSGAILIDVLANDYQADAPATIFSAGTGGVSDSSSDFRYINQAGDIVNDADGTVTIVGNQIQYEPEANFVGVDTFTYSIQDCCLPDESTPGEISILATVTVTVTQENDPPEPVGGDRTFTMFTNETLAIDSNNALIRDAYDLEYSTIDPDTGSPVGGTITANALTTPDAGGSFSFASDGTFSYTPPTDFEGETTFTYQIQDDLDSSAAINTVRIVVVQEPAPATPPAPGEVAVTFDLATTPLEQANGVTPNVLIMMDDSGSMDWNITTQGTANDGVVRLSNEGIATSNVQSISYTYLYPLADNSYLDFYFSGLSAVTEKTLRSDTRFDNNQYGAWRVYNSKFNATYYNPELRYTPWVGFDSANVAFADAVPTAARLNPIDSTNTINLLNEITYVSYLIPIWDVNGGNVFSINNTTYLPRYYTSSGTDAPDFDDNMTEPAGGLANIEGLVEICSPTATNCAPPASGFYAGSENRTDCANPAQCTYTEELQNFANWFQYYRKREFVAKSAVSSVLENVNDLRVGYETLNQRASVDVEQMNDLVSEGQKKVLYDAAFGVNSVSGTPLRDALERAGEIYSCSDAGRDCPVLPAPDGTCQQNFTLLFSDGFWNGAAGVSGDQDADAVGNPWDGGLYADGRADTLADTAMFYYKTDLHTNLEDRVVPTSRDRAARVAGEFADGDRMHQHMKTFTIAFGVEGSLDPDAVPSDPTTTTYVWPDPLSGDAAKIDDMLHAAVNGRGEFLSARNSVDLRNAVQDAFDEFSDAQSSTSAASFNSTSLRDGTLLYRGFYDLEDSTGELTATEVDENGVLATSPTWLASEQLDPANKLASARRLVTFDALARDGIELDSAQLNPDQLTGLTAAQLLWLRGDQSAESDNGGTFRDRDSARLLGDIVHSSPVFVGEPRGFNRDQAPYPTTTGNLYSDFRDAQKSRTSMVYVGANDGILHGFSAATGEELFGYVPNIVIDGTARFASEASELTDPFYSHNYYVDLTPRINDVFIKGRIGATTKSWNTVLVGGLGAGGKGYYALNVTNPASAFNTNSNAADSVLWEFTEEDDTYPLNSDGSPLGGALNAITDPDGRPVKDLGYALTLPTLAMSNAEDGGQKSWVALFGNGPNSTAGIAKLFVLFVDKGLDGWDGADDFVKISTGRGVPITEPAELIGYPNGLGSPTAVDEDLNGTVDLVYAGDRLGNLYRFDLRDSDPDNWTAVLLFTASYDDGTTVTRQPILERPLVLPHPTQDGFLITFGTGSYVTDDDASDDAIQSIYGLWDIGTGNAAATAASNSKSVRLVEQTLVNVVDDTVSPAQTRRVPSNLAVNYRTDVGSLAGVYGWYIDLDLPRATTTSSGSVNTDTSGNTPPAAQFPGERAVRRFLVRNGNIITSTVLPSTGQASCFGTRPGAILLFRAETGGVATSPTIDFNRDGVVDEGDLVDTGSGLQAGGVLLNQNDLDGSLVDLSTLGGTGDTDFLFVSGGNDTVSFRIEDVNDPRTGRLSWSELVNED